MRRSHLGRGRSLGQDVLQDTRPGGTLPGAAPDEALDTFQPIQAARSSRGRAVSRGGLLSVAAREEILRLEGGGDELSDASDGRRPHLGGGSSRPHPRTDHRNQPPSSRPQRDFSKPYRSTPGPPRREERGQGPPGRREGAPGHSGRPERSQGPSGRPERSQGPSGRPERSQGPSGRPERSQGPSGRPERTQGPSGRPERTQGPSGRPERTQGPSGRPERTQGPPGRRDGSQGSSGRPERTQGPPVRRESSPYPSGRRGSAADFPEARERAQGPSGTLERAQMPSEGKGGRRGESKDSKPHLGDGDHIIETRPEVCISKKGEHGKTVTLTSNYFKVDKIANWVIFQYKVAFNVEEDRTEAKKRLLRVHHNTLGRAYLFDGTALFTPRRLTQDNKPLLLTSVRESDKLPIQIEISLVQELNYGSIVYLKVFSILVRRALSKLKLQLVNRNYFDATASIPVADCHMEVWPGYLTSIRQNETDILMCTEITHKVMRLDTAFDFLMECLREDDDHRLKFKQGMIGQIVLTDYTNKTYRIDDVDFSSSPRSTFTLKNGEVISYVDYYRTRYNIVIRELDQPLLVSRATDRSVRAGNPFFALLIPELCRMTGLSPKMQTDNQLKKTLAEHTRITPKQRIDRLLKFNDRLNTAPEVVTEFKDWELSLSNELTTVTGRELPIEKIIVQNNRRITIDHPGDWTREIRSKPLLAYGALNKWVIICPSFLKHDCLNFLKMLKTAAGGFKMKLADPKYIEVNNDRPPTMVEAVEDCITRNKPDLIMFMCSNNRSDRYEAIKKKCTVDRGIPSQVIVARSFRARGLSVATKVIMQMNCKVGGAPWTLELPIKDAMVVGYDVCHDPCSKGESFGAIVASLDQGLSSWFSSTSHHAGGEELSDTLSMDVAKAIRRYRDVNKRLPSRIFVYRDGVGEGQIKYVYEHEVEVLKKRLTEIYGGDKWRLGYIIVSKRINTRLFKGVENPLAGTIVDDVITLPERYDFYLVSQNVNSGTVTPTNYNVISDNLGLTPDQIQRWTFKMTHLYYNWTGTVRVPAACQYAHKLAYLVGQSLQISPHPSLDSTLHFL